MTRVQVGLLVAMALVGLGIGWHAAAADPVVRAEAWAWLLQRDGLPATSPASEIESGQLPVAWIGQEEKLTFLEFGPVAEARPLTMTLAVDIDGANRNIDEADLLACVVTEPWQEESPIAWEQAPDRECETAARGVYQPATTDFFFDLTDLVSHLGGNSSYGIAVVPDPTTASQTFQVVFRAAEAGGVRLEYSGALGGLSQNGAAAPVTPGADERGLDAATSYSSGAGSSVNAAPPAEAAGLALGSPPAVPSIESSQRVAETPRPDRASFAAAYLGLVAVAVLLVSRPMLRVLLAGTATAPAARERPHNSVLPSRGGRS